jgi:hypothetical protein
MNIKSADGHVEIYGKPYAIDEAKQLLLDEQISFRDHTDLSAAIVRARAWNYTQIQALDMAATDLAAHDSGRDLREIEDR